MRYFPLDNVDPDTLYNNSDYPRLSFGSDGNGGKAMWFSITSFTTSPPANKTIPYCLTTIGFFPVSDTNIGGPFIDNIGDIHYHNAGIGWYPGPPSNLGTWGQMRLTATDTDAGKFFISMHVADDVNGGFAPATVNVGTVEYQLGTLANVAITGNVEIIVDSDLASIASVNDGIEIADTNGFYVSVGRISGVDPDNAVITLDRALTQDFAVDASVRVTHFNVSGTREVFNVNTNQVDIPYSIGRGSSNPQGYSCVYDPDSGRFYMFISESTTLFNNKNSQVSLIYTEDDGLTWSKRVKINNVDNGPRGFTHLVRDTVTGNLLLQWLDGRNDPSGEAVDTYCAILKKSFLDTLPVLCE